MERLSASDASMLALETPRAPLHTGGVGIFAGDLEFGAVLETLASRLSGVHRARQRVQQVPFGAQPAWVDDEDFDLAYHLRHAALPAPGDAGQLGQFLSRLIARPLDRSRPLWEAYLIEGLGGGRTAIFWKVHLAIAGASDRDPFAALLDDTGWAAHEPAPAGARSAAGNGAPVGTRNGREGEWQPRRSPSQAQLAAEGVRERLGDGVRLAGQLGHLATSPRALVGLTGGAVGMTARLLRRRTPSPLNRPLSAHRRFATVRARLDDLRGVRQRYGGTINDVVVAVTADGIGRLLRARGHDTSNLDLRVMVPVRVTGPARGAAAGHAEARVEIDDTLGVSTLGDGAVGVLAPLPVMEMDPVARLYRVMGELAGLKESRQAVAADRLVRMAGYGPPTLHALAARLATGEQRYHVTLSNAPGPQQPRYLRGVELEESYPFIPLAGDAALSVAVSSYAGKVFFGLLGDRSGVPDLDVLPGFLDEALEDLLAAARSGGARL